MCFVYKLLNFLKLFMGHDKYMFIKIINKLKA